MPHGGRVLRLAGTALLAVAVAACGASGGSDELVGARNRFVPGALAAAPPVADGASAPSGVVVDGPSAPTGGPSGPTSSTTVPPPSTTTTTRPPGGGGPPVSSATDTGLTRLRVAIDTQAAWVALDIEGTQILTSRVTEQVGNARVTGLGGDHVAVHGDGRAVVDLVLSIPPGTDPALTMCKNYLGPATVTVTRRTDADAVVATFLNAGTDPTVVQGCENPARHDVSRADLMGPVRWPARVDPRPLVLAHYYPWYDANDLQHDFGDRPVAPADTSDPAAVDAIVEQAQGAGVDGFIVEFDGWLENEPRSDLVYAAAEAHPGFHTSLLLDFDNLLNRYTSLDGTVLDIALTEVAERATSPSQLEVDGRPVVFLYGARRVEPMAWSAALQRLRNRTGLDPFVVTDDMWLPSPGRHLYSTNTVATLQGLLQWAADIVLNLRAIPGLDGGTGPLFAAPVSPGYDDRRLGRPAPVYVDRRGGARYDEQWTAAMLALPDWITVSTWNEYYELTHVAPGETTGTLALEQTATWADRFHADG